MFTELDIINSMLRTIGVGGLTSTDTDHPDYMEAKQVLDDTLMDVNKLGYWYNTSYPSLAPNAQGEIILPSNTLSVDTLDRTLNYVRRGNRLFDQENRTFNIGESVDVKLVINLSLDEMPVHAQSYVRAKARYDFYADNEGDLGRTDRLDRDRKEQWQEFYSQHIRSRDINHRDSPSSMRIKRGTRGASHEYRIKGIGF